MDSWIPRTPTLSDFRVRGTREAGERWWGLAGPQQCSGGKGGRLLSDTWGVRGRARKRGAGGGALDKYLHGGKLADYLPTYLPTYLTNE